MCLDCDTWRFQQAGILGPCGICCHVFRLLRWGLSPYSQGTLVATPSEGVSEQSVTREPFASAGPPATMASSVKVYLRTRPTDNVQGSFTCVPPNPEPVTPRRGKPDSAPGTPLDLKFRRLPARRRSHLNLPLRPDPTFHRQPTTRR